MHSSEGAVTDVPSAGADWLGGLRPVRGRGIVGAMQGNLAPHDSRRRSTGRLGEFTVGEAAKRVGVSPSTLRSWEREGLVTCRRSPSGYRYFDLADLAVLQQVAYLRRVEGLNSAGIRKVLNAGRPALARDEGSASIDLATKLRRLRRDRGLTLEGAAKEALVSPSFLSALERNRTGVAQETLLRLLTVYGATLESILREGSPDHVARVTRANRRAGADYLGVRLERLVTGEARMDPSLLTLEPGAAVHHDASHHGEEFIFVLEGDLEVTLHRRERHRLKAGDSIYFPSPVEHRWRNRSADATRVLWINTPPTF